MRRRVKGISFVMLFFCFFALSGISVLGDDGFEIIKIEILDYKPSNSGIGEDEKESLDKKGLDMEFEQVRGVWVASIYNIDFPKAGATTDSSALKKEIDSIVANCQDLGFNTIFFQVRPSADALYKSEIFPWSKYLTGENRAEPSDGFDPLKYIIEEAHERNMKVQPWINPYRVAVNVKDFESLPKTHPAKKNPEWVVKHGTGPDAKYFFDPGIPEVEKLVLDGIEEIIDNYNIDGIHIDDYFYPSGDFNDGETFKKYSRGISDIGKWRRENVTNLVKSIGELARDRGTEFGVSPFGIWANDTSFPSGSKTNGSESYYKMYADSQEWIQQEYIDYIIPQIYWNIGLEIADYKVLVQWWNNQVKYKDVELYIGQAAYRTEDVSKSSVWYGSKELEKQITLNESYNNIDGFVMFNYSTVMKNSQLKSYLREKFK